MAFFVLEYFFLLTFWDKYVLSENFYVFASQQNINNYNASVGIGIFLQIW